MLNITRGNEFGLYQGYIVSQKVLQRSVVKTIAVSFSVLMLPWPTQAQQANLQEGTQIRLNGQPMSGAWAMWQDPAGRSLVGLSDGAWMQALGGELGNTENSSTQPLSWYGTPLSVQPQWNPAKTLRYLSISTLAQQYGWQMQPQGSVLTIQTPATTVQSIRLDNPSVWERRLVLTLDRPTPWQMKSLTNSRSGKKDRTFSLALGATVVPSVVPPLPTLPKAPTIEPKQSSDSENTEKTEAAKQPKPVEPPPKPSPQAVRELKVLPQVGRTVIEGVIDGRAEPQIQTLANPPRLVIDFALPKPKNRSIQWAPGLRWQERPVGLGQHQFPMVWLTLNPRQPGLNLLPIWNNPRSLLGKEVLTTMAQRNQAAAGINAGFFTRDRETPLGAIRRNGEWLSSPILNRGVVAWNPQGQLKVGRLTLQESIQTNSGQPLSITALNSGYPQKGIARYTPSWGPTYLPLQKSEQIVTVINDQVQSTQPAKVNTAVPIPANGYLLALRALETPLTLAPGTQLQRSQIQLSPAEFANYTHILGAGPLLIENSRIVVNAADEKFNPTFVKQSADRSAIAQTADGSILLVVTHNRLGGAGPTLEEWAALLRQMGAVNALNLDGGSSTMLYLGGQLLDRHITTATPVHNGIGVFLRPSP
jgi:hypothetical protein